MAAPPSSACSTAPVAGAMCSPVDSSLFSQALKPKVAATIIASNKRGIMGISSLSSRQSRKYSSIRPGLRDARCHAPETRGDDGTRTGTLDFTRCAPQRHPSGVSQDLTGADGSINRPYDEITSSHGTYLPRSAPHPRPGCGPASRARQGPAVDPDLTDSCEGVIAHLDGISRRTGISSFGNPQEI
jgi:hypothetical protein